MNDERAATLDALARVLAGARAVDVVPAVLRALTLDSALDNALDNEGRARVARRIYGASVLRLRLAWLAGVAALPENAAVLLDAYTRFVEDGAAAARAWPADPFERLVVEHACPAELAGALVDSLGLDGAAAFLAASNVPGPRVLRANALRCTREELRERLAGEGVATVPGTVAALALVVEGRANLFGSEAWRAGWFEVQDEGSQRVAEACAVKPGDVVVDLCAGRGGKTLALAAAMRNQGTLWVNDVDEGALADMKPRLARAGVTCVRRGLPGEGAADVVLVDAPCSSTGVLRRSPDLRFSFRRAAVGALAAVQRRLLEDGARLVKPGGRLVYATCSVLAAENDAVVDAPPAGFDEDGPRLRLLPHMQGTDGFFVAALRRRRRA